MRADPNVTTNRISLQQVMMENRAGLMRLAEMVSKDMQTIAGAVSQLEAQFAEIQRMQAALQNQLLAASKGMNVSFTRTAQQPQMQPVGIGVPTHALRPQAVEINSPGSAIVNQAPAWVQGSAADIAPADGGYGDADSVFYSGGD